MLGIVASKYRFLSYLSEHPELDRLEVVRIYSVDSYVGHEFDDIVYLDIENTVLDNLDLECIKAHIRNYKVN